MATKKFSAWARMTAVGAALAVSMLGLAGTAHAAEPGNIDPAKTTSLTLHKFETPNPAWATKNDGNAITVPADAVPLEGVQFKVTPVTAKDAVAIDLTTPAGWDAIKGATPAAVQAAPWTLGTPIEDATTKTGADGTFSKALPKGLYLVQETGAGNNQISGPTPAFLVTLPFPDAGGNKWIYDVHVYPKNDVSHEVVEKTVNDPSLVTQPADVVWDITVPIAAGPFTKVEIKDTLDSRLTYKSVAIVQDGTTLPASYYDVTGNVVITFTETGLANLKPNKPLEIALTTTVPAGSLGIIDNTVDVAVNDWLSSTDPTDPNYPGGPVDPDDPDFPVLPSTNWGKLQVTKHVAGSETTVLGGAEFAVYSDATATTQVGTITTDATTGIGSLNLWVGNDDDVTQKYWLKETKAPAGYVLDATVREITVTADETVASTVNQNVANTKHTGPDLPLTGSSGTLGMVAAGLALVVVGGGLAYRRRSHTA